MKKDTLINAAELKKVKWDFCGIGCTFDGYTDGTKWNGFSNIWVDEKNFLLVIEDLARDYNYDFEKMFNEVFFDDIITPNKNGLYCFGYGYTRNIIS